MQRQHTYPLSYSPHAAHMPRYSSSHSTSSAFSASAQPNEDWTKISDLAERRRIQNRIAQRNYRKKIKRRLEDLEKRASSSPSPEQGHRELPHKSSTKRNNNPRRPSMKREAATPTARKPPPEPLTTPYPPLLDHPTDIPSMSYKREISLSPPHLSYPYPIPGSTSPPSYQVQPAFSSLPPYSDYPSQSSYLSTLPTTLPAMSSYEPSPIKPGFYEEDSTVGPCGMSYAPFTSMDIPMHQSYPESNLNTPPLSHSRSFDRSRDGSPSMALPVTPISIPDSPRMEFR